MVKLFVNIIYIFINTIIKCQPFTSSKRSILFLYNNNSCFDYIVNKNDLCTLSYTTCIDFIVKNVGNVVLCCHFEAGIAPCPLVVLNTKHKCNFIVFL